MRDRRQTVLLTTFVAGWVLVAIGLVGAAIPGVPRSVSSAVAVTGLIVVAFFIPGALLYGLLRKDPVAFARSRAVAVKWRRRLAFGGGWAFLVGASIVFASPQFRIAGAIVLIWGVLCLLILGLSVRPVR